MVLGATPGLPSAAWPLVGRAEEVDVVVGHLLERESGFLVTGAPGVGKTRLAREVLGRVAARGVRTAWLAGTQATAAIPLGVLAPLIGPLEHPERPLESFDLLAVVVARLRDAENQVVAVDDVGHLDDLSATVLHQLAQSGAMTLLCTVRSAIELADPVTALCKDCLGARLELASLARDEVDELVVRALGGPVDALSLELLWRHSAGNPMLVRELVSGGLEEGTLRAKDGLWSWDASARLPRRLGDVLAERIGALGAAERLVLDSLAIGGELPFGILEALSGSEAVVALEGRGVLELTGHPVDTALVRLAHPLYGEIVRAVHRPLQAAELRRRLADAAQAAGPLEGELRLRVALWRLDAGDEVDLALLESAALDALATARPLVERLARPAWEHAGSPRAGLTLGLALAEGGQFEESGVVLSKVLESPAASRGDRAEALMHLSIMYVFGAGLPDEGIRLLQEATTLDPELGPDCVGLRAAIELMCGRTDEAAELVAALVDDPSTSERALLRGALVRVGGLAVNGRTSEAIALAERALVLPPLVNLDAGTAQLVGGYVLALLWAGQIDRAAEVAADYRRRFLSAPFPRSYAVAMAGHGFARSLVYGGQLAAGVEAYADALRSFETENLGAFGMFCGAGLATALAMMGHFTRAEEALARAEALRAPPVRQFDADLMQARAWVVVGSGDLRAAKALLVEAADLAHGVGSPAVEASVLHDVVRLGDAEAVVERLAAVVEPLDAALLDLFVRHGVAVAGSDLDGLEAAVEGFEAVGARLLAAEAAAQAYDVHRRRGTGKQTAAAQRARRLYGNCSGASRPVALAEEVRLTAREREVASLAVMGVSNRDIAERLVISVRTAESHLQHVYAKLGVTTRAELAQVLGSPASHTGSPRRK